VFAFVFACSVVEWVAADADADADDILCIILGGVRGHRQHIHQ
jgi:hypothetical protein